MKTEIKLLLRVYSVEIRDERTGKKANDTIVLTKDQTRAVESLSMTSDDLIHRIYNRKGYRVLSISKPIKQEITIDLYDAYTGTAFPALNEIHDATETNVGVELGGDIG